MGDYSPVLKQEPDGVKREEKAIPDAEKPGVDKAVPETIRPLKLFKYADKFDIGLLLVSAVAGLCGAVLFPVALYYYSNAISIFVYRSIYQNINNRTISTFLQFKYSVDDVADLHNVIKDEYAVTIAIFGILIFISIAICRCCNMISGERQMERIRTLYFRSLLSHDVTWYDVNNTKALAASFTSDMDSLADGISQKLITSLQRIVVWLTCNICALVMEWRLGLSLLAFLPLNILIAIVMSKVGGKAANREQEEYSTAGGIAEEVIGAIRTVLAFNGQENECKRYRSNLGKAEKYLVIKGVATGFGANLFAFVFSCIASVCVYYGIELFITDNIEPGNMIGVFILASAGSLSLVTASQNSQFVAEAREVAQRVYPIIDRHARRDVTGKSGIIPKHVEGRLEIKNVSFAYPARPEVQVIKDVNFTVAPGRTIALVGNSGCGKSTIVQLLEKFYTPQQGEITLDGINIAHLNTEWLRRQIGFVGQEPVLLSTSISENIRIGNTSATDEDIIRAATIANADGFIKQLPKGYDTYVGESGCQLSGGQKQRIAIARALVRDPSILLLDEATSALDLAGEVIVQKAIDKAKQGRTTVLIAHRLSTVIGADIIFVINDGQIVEQGTHTELLQKDGYYRKLVNSQIGLAVDSEELEEMDTLSMENKVEDLKEKENTDVTETKIKQKKKKSTSLKVLKLMAPEKCLVIIGMILTMIGSFAFPVLPFIVSEALTLFQKSPEEARAIGRELVAILMSVAVCAFIVRIAGTVILQKTAAKLTTRIRDTLFTAFMYKDVEYFDREENRVGLLTTRLSSDAIAIHGVSAVKLSNNLDGTVAIIIALGAALYVNWKLCLLLLILLPFNFIASNFLGRISNSKRETNTQGSLEITGQIVQEAMSNIRLVFSFSSEATLLRKFQEAAADLRRKTVRTNLAPCIIAPLLDANLFFLVAIALTYGSFIVQYENIEFHQIIRVFMLLNQISIGIGRYSSLSPDFIKARSAADRIFAVIENQSQINVKGKQGRSLPEFQGNLKFNKVSFQYASSDVASHVLHDVTLDVTSGMKLALVGPSGCGKTTTVSLIHRLYDVTSGCVLADGHDIRELDVSWLRSQMGLVSQEPVLFDRTIAENIQYGDNSREVPLSDVIEVSRMANLHEFVTSLPQGYDTHCGHKGTLLSGGEKQRVAIARALVRKPKLLLLDEATSALDSHNEKIVQEAIERASQGRTTIVIAHRLSTIQDCDHIAVFRHGTIVEAGTHQELIAAKGDYYRLLQAQQS